MGNIVNRYLPTTIWLPCYRKEWLRLDVVAGLTTAAVVIPKAMATATIAGLPAQAEIPLAPWVKGHSIIAVKGDGDPKRGNDGVVEYTSAHLDGMESEFIVRSDHSNQLNPLAIDEVRRILLEHSQASFPDMPHQK